MPDLTVLVLNAGSSTLKFSLFRAGARRGRRLDLALRGSVEKSGSRACLRAVRADGELLVERTLGAGRAGWVDAALRCAGEELRGRSAGLIVGHRVVHGGAAFDRTVKVTGRVLRGLERLVPLAPLHQPDNLAAIRAVERWNPTVPQVVCPDTAFHREHPLVADLYALPWRLYRAGVRRYGFPGLSHEHVASRLPRLSPALGRGRVVVAHLGSGASLCALRAGRSVAASMGSCATGTWSTVTTFASTARTCRKFAAGGGAHRRAAPASAAAASRTPPPTTPESPLAGRARLSCRPSRPASRRLVFTCGLPIPAGIAPV